MTHSSLQEEVARYCEKTNTSPKTLGVKLFNNSRIVERLTRRVESDQEKVDRLRRFMAENPPPDGAAEAGDAEVNGHAPVKRKGAAA